MGYTVEEQLMMSPLMKLLPELTKIFVFLIVILFVFGYFINKLHKLKYKKGSFLAYIPIANSYVLGKAVKDEHSGAILCIWNVVGIFLGFFPIMQLINLYFWIEAIVQYNSLKKRNNNQINNKNENTSNSTTEVVGNVEITNNDSNENNNSINKTEIKTVNGNTKNDSQIAINESSVSVEPLSGITENNSKQQTPSKQDSASSSLQDLYK